MHVEFKSPNWATPDWILEDDKIIVKKRLGNNKEYYLADIEHLTHFPYPQGIVKYPRFAFSVKGHVSPDLYYSNDEPVKSQGMEAVIYIKSKMLRLNKSERQR